MPPKTKSRVGILGAVSDWLKLLALVVLVAEATILGAMYLTPGDHPIRAWYPVILLLFLMIPVIGLFWDRSLHIPHKQIQPPAAIVIDKSLDGLLTRFRENVHAANNLGIEPLTAEISVELERLNVESKQWREGQFNSSVQRYRKLLLDLYEWAEKSIFSTTIRDYLDSWQEELMERMISASEKSAASSVIRVFVFSTRAEIDERAVAVLRHFQESPKIRPLVYIDKEDDRFHFPPDVSRDFVVMDHGEAIGVTLSYGPGNIRAQWYFRDEERKPVFNRICSGLERGSVDAADIIRWWTGLQSSAR